MFLADCPARTTLDLVANTWSVVVIFGLRDGPQRYGELHGRIGGVSRKVLTQTLRRLEANGLVTRRHIRAAPPGVEYRLTPLGHSLVEPVTVLSRWAEQYAEAVAAAREATLAAAGDELGDVGNHLGAAQHSAMTQAGSDLQPRSGPG